MTDRSQALPDGTGIRVFPPVVLVIALAAAFALDWAWPSRVGLPDVARRILGVALIILPIVVMPMVLAAFRRVGAAFDVRRVPAGLATDGPYRFSRNPGYLAGVAFCAGIGLLADNPWAFLTLVGGLAFIHVTVVLPEEALLENRFGEVYLDYKRRVRRWL